MDSKYIRLLHTIEKQMDPQQNYLCYRGLEQQAIQNDQPFIPFLALYLRDLTFGNDGNTKLTHNGQLVHFGKNWSVYDIVSRFRQLLTSGTYHLAQDEKLFDYTRKIIALPEKRLYEYSKLCEQPAQPTNSMGGPPSAQASQLLLLQSGAASANQSEQVSRPQTLLDASVTASGNSERDQTNIRLIEKWLSQR